MKRKTTIGGSGNGGGRCRRSLGLALLLTLTLPGCDWGAKVDPKYDPATRDDYREGGTIWGSDSGGGLNIFGGSDDDAEGGGGTPGISVNAFLWRATLDTIAFMPLASADPFGGVIITDWYMPPESPTERFKVNAYILSRTLRSDGVRVKVFRQRLHPSGSWIDAPVGDETATDLENAVLTRARELRIAAKSGND